MKTFAVIEEQKVVNIIIADSKEIAEETTGKLCIEYTEKNPAGIGWDYDGVLFIPPAIRESDPTVELIAE